jgi:RNA polymerase sigma-70 factor (ECF subfamily)
LGAPPVAPTTAIDERAVVLGARTGDRDAFDVLATAAMPRLLGTARRLLGDALAAEEVVAEALFRAWRAMRSFRGESGFATWAHRIVVRVVADRYRAEARRRRHERASAASAATSAASSRARAEARETAERLRGAVEALPPTQRLVLLLVAWEGLDLRDVASLLRMRYATVKSNLSHARRTLAAWLGLGEGDDASAGRGA